MKHALVVHVVGILSLLNLTRKGDAQEAVHLREHFSSASQFQVSVRVELSGVLNLPAEKNQAQTQQLKVTGKSAIDYDERVLSVSKDGAVTRSVRLYRRVDFQRTVGTQQQQSTVRPAVRRLVILRQQQVEVPFSPDGPLTWNEIDLIRTDVFTPALVGLLPDGAVRSGDRWNASLSAIQELTDMEKIEEGQVVCKLEQVTQLANRKHARVSFSGSVRGLGEDGPNRQQLEGSFFFDLEANHLSYLSLQGTRQLVDKDGKAAGTVQGTFVVTRQPQPGGKDLTDEALRGVALEPNENNTLLLYDNPELGVRLLHPRNWRVAGVRGRQLALDEHKGSGLLLTLEPLKDVPAAAQFLQESRTFLEQKKATILGTDKPRVVQNPPQQLAHFSLDVEIAKERVLMEYYVLRQAAGGGTIAARLLRQDLAVVRRDVERIARSVVVGAAK